MVENSYLIQNSALTEQAKAARIESLRNTLRAEFARRFRAPLGDIIVRSAEPDEDLAFADTQQITGALVTDTETDYVVRDIRNINTVIGFYAINNLSANPSVNRIRFKIGATPGSGVKGSVYLESLYAASEPKGWLEQPIIYAQDRMLIRVEAFQTVAAPGERVVLEALVAEQLGGIVSVLE